MTAKLLTGMSSLTETENKNSNIQTTKQKQNKTKNKSKPQKNSETPKENGKSFTTMISRPDTALTDFTSNLKGYLSHKCNVPLQKLKA